MFARLLLLFIIVPLLDLFLLLAISKVTSLSFTVLVVIVSGILGAWLAKRQSMSVGMKIRHELTQNQIPSSLLTDGAMILFAAGLLITPGLITDVFGLTLLIPISRAWYKKVVMRWLKAHFHINVTKMQSRTFDTDIVDGEVVSSNEKTEKPETVPPNRLQ